MRFHPLGVINISESERASLGLSRPEEDQEQEEEEQEEEQEEEGGSTTLRAHCLHRAPLGLTYLRERGGRWWRRRTKGGGGGEGGVPPNKARGKTRSGLRWPH